MADYSETAQSLERPSDLEKNPSGVVKRWLLELKLADKRESEWRKKGEKVWKLYRQQDRKRNTYNILWANTETLRPAIYNSLPKPDVRRRYKDEDPMGKAVSQVIGRSLEYGLDTTDFDETIKACVLDTLLPGRGVARVRYVPSLTEAAESTEGETEELEWEQCPIEHVQWDDFRLSEGKEWQEVCWIAFKHRLSRDELEKQFGDIAADVPLDNTDDDDIKAEQDGRVSELFKTAEVWEIWDKDTRQVLFIAKGYKESPLKLVQDPLSLQGFFPIPRPVYAVEDSSSLVPVPLYELYREQADELDRVTARINTIIKGLKLRGVYDATLSELSELMRGEDNDLIPAANVTAIIDRGGLDKAIWMMPIDMAALVLKELYVQREQTKAVIYEITGISDILRGSTVASETATAQQIKNQWGTMRLKRMQSDVARFIRDLMRIQAEIIGERFQLETLQQMTGLQLPMMAQKQQMMFQAQQTGQQPPHLPPAWEEVIQVMRDDKQRTFKVDVETDSTVAASVETDMAAMKDLLAGVVQLVQGFGPAVQMGAMPVEAVKEMILAVTRRAKLGNAVEDALDKIKQPEPQAQDNSAQIEKMKQDAVMQAKQAELQQSSQLEQAKMQHEERLQQIKAQSDAMIEQTRLESENDLKWRVAQLDAETKVIVATIAANQKAQADQLAAQQAAQQSAMDAENEALERETQQQERAEGEAKHGELQETIATALESFQAAIERLSQPRTVIRGPDGRIAGVQ